MGVLKQRLIKALTGTAVASTQIRVSVLNLKPIGKTKVPDPGNMISEITYKEDTKMDALKIFLTAVKVSDTVKNTSEISLSDWLCLLDTVDKMTGICESLGMTKAAEKFAQLYQDVLDMDVYDIDDIAYEEV